MNKKVLFALLFSMLSHGCNLVSHQYASRAAQFYFQKNYTDAASEFRMAIRYEPNNPMLRYGLGLSYANQGKFDMAEEIFDELLEIAPHYSNKVIRGYRMVVDAYRDEHSQIAFRVLKKIILLDPTLDGSSNRFTLGFGYFLEGDYSQAAEYLDRALAHAPDHPDSHDARYLLALCYKFLEQPDRAFDQFLLVYPQKLSSDYQDHYSFQFGETAYAYAETCFVAQKYETALTAVSTLLHQNRSVALIEKAYFLQGSALQRLNRNQEAVASYQRIIDSNPFQRGQSVFQAKKEIKKILSNSSGTTAGDPADKPLPQNGLRF